MAGNGPAEVPENDPVSTDVKCGDDAVATFPVTLNLATMSEAHLEEAATAIKQEYRTSVRRKRLRCRNWEHLTEREDGSIFALEVGRSVEFDWTWEGAIAYRPGISEDSFADDESDDTPDDEMYWCGEVVEVDETGGRIFVSISNPDQKPTTGTFFVRPFEFLALLNKVYNDESFEDLRRFLPVRLAASEGGIYPPLEGPASLGLPELQPMWEHAWGILWGPPGAGKTHNIGQQVARCLDDPGERILVVSTTNKATDGAALQIGEASREINNRACSEGRVLRAGKGVNLKRFRQKGLEDLIRGTETDLLHQVSELKEELARATAPESRAELRDRIKKLLQQVKDASRHAFLATDVDVVVATAFRASTMLWHDEFREMIEEGRAPFTTVIIDEAGLISRTATAVLSLLASRRVILAGDPKQLAPISRMSRVLPTSQARWLASSGLSHLRQVDQGDEGMHLLDIQYRMHPEVNTVVSDYQYGGKLQTADVVKERAYQPPPLLRDQPRTIWYLLDEDGSDLPSIRAERGPCNRSWVRKKTRDVLDKLFSDTGVQVADGLFLSPFVAQAKDIASLFAEKGYTSWTASTVHSQQGAEADIVIFDTVNASSTSWPIQEWLRLINVGLSRAREFVVLVASRAEMQSPYLKPLLRHLQPMVLTRSGTALRWTPVSAAREFIVPDEIATTPELLGYQITQRKSMRPVLSADQQRLCGYRMDGKPRLVRGVAGSGKTVVLAHWLRMTLDHVQGNPNAKVWSVFANGSLRKLLTDTIEAAWEDGSNGHPFPWERVELWHVRDLLDLLLREVGQNMGRYKFEYDQAAGAYLQAMQGLPIRPRCHALFADEGQDLGPNTLKLLTTLVEHADPEQPNSRSINIFYDNAQNLYGRGTPKWSEMGLNMRGRSTVMKESFRSTRPITELAFNVLHRLLPDEAKSPDHEELVERGLVELVERAGVPWWNVRFAQIDGPVPSFQKFPSMETQFDGIGKQLIRWIKHEGVKPSDICIIFMSDYCKWRLENHVKTMLGQIEVGLEVQRNQSFVVDDRTVIATSPHSFKGYDSEIVVIPSIERFQAKGKPLTQALYVAMTRARSVLALYGKSSKEDGEREILEALEACLDALVERPAAEPAIPESDEFEDILTAIGTDHRDWLVGIRKSHRVVQEPMLGQDGVILCEPLFWYESQGRRYACFPKGKPTQRIRNQVDDAGVVVLQPA
jgi:superfamily I DNA/RNA helicase